jgi:hypothetical protein
MSRHCFKCNKKGHYAYAARSSVSSATRKVIMPTLVLPVEVEMVAAMKAVAAEAIVAVEAMAEVDVEAEVVTDSTRR